MDDPGDVGFRQRLGCLEEVIDRLRRDEGTGLAEALSQIDALEVLHSDERCAVGRARDVEHADDVRALDLRGELSFAHETVDDRENSPRRHLIATI